MVIRTLRILVAASVLTGSAALGSSLGNEEVKNWPAPVYWSPSVMPASPTSTAVRRDLAGEASETGAFVVVPAPSAPFFFVSLPPCRLADTRGNGFTGAYGPPSLGGGASRNFTITGQCGIPSSAAAVSFNFTVWNTLSYGDLKVYPTGGTVAAVSTLNWNPGVLALANAAVVPLGSGGSAGQITTVNESGSPIDLFIDINGYYALSGDRNPVPNSPGAAFAVQGGGASLGGTDQAGGDMTVAGGIGTGLGGGGNLHLQTAGANDLSGTTDNGLVSRRIIVGKAKQMTLASPGFTSLMSIHLTGTHTAGGRIFYVVRATDGGSQVATEEGVIQYLATANSITCTVQTTDKLHLGTVNSGCTPGFFNPLSQPGVSIFDNVAFSSPAPIVVHEVYFTIENESGSAIRLEP